MKSKVVAVPVRGVFVCRCGEEISLPRDEQHFITCDGTRRTTRCINNHLRSIYEPECRVCAKESEAPKIIWQVYNDQYGKWEDWNREPSPTEKQSYRSVRKIQILEEM